MQIDANDVINNLSLKLAQQTQQLAISEVRAETAEARVKELEENENNGS